MFSRITITNSTENYSQQIEQIREKLNNADAVVIGAGAGLSTAAGLTYSGERFYKHFFDFAEKYGIIDMYSGGFYPFPDNETFWAWWSRHIYFNRYEKAPKPVYDDLLKLVKDRNYFVLTTNVDHQFQMAGFDKERLFYTQGDYGLFQCSVPCHDKNYDNYDDVIAMIEQQENMRIPTELIPHCPVCGKPMTMNLRSDDKFVEDEGWHKAAERYNSFIDENKDKNIVYLELGVGGNTPVIIKFPFWQLTAQNENAAYICVNLGESYCPDEIADQSICVNADIGKVINDLN
ncbi:MAG: Sir2 silent information regulator family NAD-dependent deacetylase [Ruminococcus sp.]|nr:Sir2 silent information regulator family NAD-dependent deacetylase [Ruminococcus sp.]